MIKFSELNTTKRCEGLVPAIIQDDNTRQVLMLGYMNEEAYSGNFLNVKSIVKDCDDDTLLIRVVPVGPVCHKGTKTCFGGRENEGFIGELQSVIQQRHREMPEGSYTTKLFTKGVKKIAQKVGEEAVETVIEAVANNNTDVVY